MNLNINMTIAAIFVALFNSLSLKAQITPDWSFFVTGPSYYMEPPEAFCDVIDPIEGLAYIDSTMVDTSYYWSNFYASDIQYCISPGTSIEIRVKNLARSGAITARDIGLYLNGGWGSVECVVIPDSVGLQYAYAKAGTASVTGIPELVVAHNDWGLFRFDFIDNYQVNYYFNNSLLTSLVSPQSICDFNELIISMKGSGILDWVKIYEGNQVVYHEDFLSCEDFIPMPSCSMRAFTNTTIPCQGEPLSIWTTGNPNAQYFWSGPNGFTSNLQNPTIPDYSLSNAGWYYVTSVLNNCEQKDSIFIGVGCNGCVNDVDFNTWEQKGNPLAGNWVVSQNGTFVHQTINGDPTFFVSPFDVYNAEIKGIFSINTEFDDDWPGVVLGFQDPMGSDYNKYQFILFGWKKGDQPFCSNQFVAQEGFFIAEVDGTILPGCAVGERNYHFWGINSGANFNVLDTHYGQGLGWKEFTNYEVRITYTPTRIKIWIDNILIFEIDGCFDRGRFGFYNHSQADIFYSDFSYTLASNFEMASSEICVGEVAQFEVINACDISEANISSFGQLIWNFGDGNTLHIQTPSSLNINPSHVYENAGTYIVELVQIDPNGCSDTITKPITVNPLPKLDLGSDIIACVGDQVLLDGGIDNCSYLWQDGTQDRYFSVSATGQYSVMVNCNGCSFFDTINVHYYDSLLIEYDLSPSCFGQDNGWAAIMVDGGTTPYSYKWSHSTENSPMVENLPPGAYQLTVTDVNFCEEYVAFEIEEFVLPGFSLTKLDISCFGEVDGVIQFFSSGSIEISIDGIEFFSVLEIDGLSADVYTFYIRDGHGCIYEESIEIIEPPLLEVFLPRDTSILLGDTIVINSSNNWNSDLDYKWQSTQALSCTDCKRPTAYPIHTATYTIVATNNEGCEADDQVNIRILKERKTGIPNVFSPNNDGINDYFRVLPWKNVAKVNPLRIYTRMGYELLTIIDPVNKGWDGTLKGRELPQGVYVYIVEVLFIDGHTEFFKGDITILR